MKFNRAFAVTASSLILVACGGGGGGGGPSYTKPSISPTVPPVVAPTSPVPFAAPVLAGVVNPLVTSTYHTSIVETFNADLQNTGVQSVIVAGRESTTSQTATDWKSSAISLFGWNNGTFQNLTSQWFSGTDNIVLGTEPSIRFGNFTGNGYNSMFVAPGTDGNVPVSSAEIFVNNGTSFTRKNIDFGYNIWSHDSTTFRWNGVDNIVTLDYGPNTTFIFGSPTGNFVSKSVNNWGMGGSSIAAGNFLGNGTTTFVVADTGNLVYSTRLFNWNYDGNTVSVTDIGALPMPIFEQAQYNGILPETNAQNGNRSHNIRAMAWNFDNNFANTSLYGATDVVIVSRPSRSGNASAGWPVGSAIQFLQNDGHGNFTDVTNQYVVGYDRTKQASYNPFLMDLTGSGLIDIVLPAPDATQILMQTSDHKFVSSYATVLTDFQNQVASIQGITKDGPGQVTFVKGPNGNLYLLEMLDVNLSNVNGGVSQKAIYLSMVGNQNSTSASATVNLIKQTWPYMSSAQVNSTLVSTGTYYYGALIVDPTAALNPVGSVTMPLASGHAVALNGYLNGVNLNGAANQVQVFDQIGRNYSINLQSSNINVTNYWGFNTEIVDQHQLSSHTEYLINGNVANLPVSSTNSIRVGSDPKNFTVGTPAFNLGRNWQMNVQYTTLAFNPWIQFGGVYGAISDSTTTELVTTYKNESWTSQLGLLYNTTNITPGLITSVGNMVGAWAETGYRSLNEKGNGFGIYAGVKPVILSGNVEAKLPTSVDNQGNIHYTSTTLNVQNPVNSYVRLIYTGELDKFINYTLGGILVDNGQFRLQALMRVNF